MEQHQGSPSHQYLKRTLESELQNTNRGFSPRLGKTSKLIVGHTGVRSFPVIFATFGASRSPYKFPSLLIFLRVSFQFMH